MMTKKQSNKSSMLNYIPALFIGGILCTAFTCITIPASALSFISEERSVITEETIPPTDTSTVYQVVKTMPKFNGNMEAWIKENLKYPAKAQETKEEGNVYVSIVIEKDGSVSNAKIVKKVNPLLDTEALRIVKAMPAWIPGKQEGEVVRVAYIVPINFTLPAQPKVYTVVENMPQFKGDLNVWLKENLKYPAEAKEAKQQGKATVYFIVNEDGRLSDIKIQRSSGSEILDKEALRVVKMMPAWIPGKQKGKAVKTNFYLPLNFTL